jgi:hypothetical protein
MRLSRAQLVSAIAATYVLVVFGGMIIRYFKTGDWGTFQYSLMLPNTIGALFVGSLIALGLWNRFAWAWWLGLFAVIFQFYRLSGWLVPRLGNGFPPLSTWIIGILLIAFLWTLLTKEVRRSCSR